MSGYTRASGSSSKRALASFLHLTEMIGVYDSMPARATKPSLKRCLWALSLLTALAHLQTLIAEPELDQAQEIKPPETGELDFADRLLLLFFTYRESQEILENPPSGFTDGHLERDIRDQIKAVRRRQNEVEDTLKAIDQDLEMLMDRHPSWRFRSWREHFRVFQANLDYRLQEGELAFISLTQSARESFLDVFRASRAVRDTFQQREVYRERDRLLARHSRRFRMRPRYEGVISQVWNASPTDQPEGPPLSAAPGVLLVQSNLTQSFQRHFRSWFEDRYPNFNEHRETPHQQILRLLADKHYHELREKYFEHKLRVLKALQIPVWHVQESLQPVVQNQCRKILTQLIEP